VIDFPQLIRDRSKYLFETINRAVLNKEKDVELVSPLHQAANIKAPLLLIAGEKDAVVPVKNSRNMYKKLKRLKKDVEYIELENGEHWRTYEPHEITTFKAIETFLAKHLGEDTAL
jgi:dipeptidyl aminopeptidase/acylaminoacyl peptidase